MKNVFYFALLSFGLLFSCTQNEDDQISSNSSAKLVDYSKLTITDLISGVYQIDLEKSYQHLLKIYQIKEKNGNVITRAQIEEIGDPKSNYELLYALAVSENFKQEQLISNEELKKINSNNENELESRSTRSYKWDGVNHYYSFFWRTNYYLCFEYVNFTGSCTGASARTKVWRSCKQVNCNRPRCLF